MSWFSRLWSWLGNNASNIGESVLNKYTGAGLTGAEREANQFNAEQAQLSRDWEAEMYERYNSPSAMMAQYQDAGINPALMYGSSAPMPAAQSANSPAGSVAPNGGDFVSSLASLVQLRSQLDLTRSQTAKNEAEADAIPKSTEAEVSKNNALAAEALSKAEGYNIDNKYKNAFNDWKILLDSANYALLNSKKSETDANTELIVNKSEHTKALCEKTWTEVAEINEHILLMQSQEQLNEAQCEEVAAKILQIQATCGKIAAETGLVAKDIEHYIWNHAVTIDSSFAGIKVQERIGSDGSNFGTSMAKRTVDKLTTRKPRYVNDYFGHTPFNIKWRTRSLRGDDVAKRSRRSLYLNKGN